MNRTTNRYPAEWHETNVPNYTSADIRGADNNSLLRMSDQLKPFLDGANKCDRAKAERLARLIAHALVKRCRG